MTWAARAAGLTPAGRNAGGNGAVGRVGQGAVPQPGIQAGQRLANAGTGIGMVQPARCASTDSSAHTVIRRSVSAARCAARICRSVQGAWPQSGPQEADRRPMILSGGAGRAGRVVSRAVPSGMRARTG